MATFNTKTKAPNLEVALRKDLERFREINSALYDLIETIQTMVPTSSPVARAIDAFYKALEKKAAEEKKNAERAHQN